MKVIMNKPTEIIARLGLEPDGEFHQWFTNTCALHMDKYVPFDEGILAGTVVNNGVLTANVTESTITYDTPYASYQYYGVRQDGSHKINEANRNIEKHPLATSYWDKEMVTAEMQDIEEEIHNYFKRGNI